MRLLIGAGTPREAAARAQAWLLVFLAPDVVVFTIVIDSEDEAVVLLAIATTEPH